MERKQSRNIAEYDVPIERPFDELPTWFTDRLNSRFVTKRFPKPGDAGRNDQDRTRRTGADNTAN